MKKAGEKRIALVADDRERELNDAAAEMRRRGYKVVTASSKREAKEKIRSLIEAGKAPDKLLTDLDFGRKIYQKHRMRDGYFLAKWAAKMGIPDITIHSTEFEADVPLLFRLINRASIERGAKRRGISLRPKSEILGYSGSTSLPRWYKIGKKRFRDYKK